MALNEHFRNRGFEYHSPTTHRGYWCIKKSWGTISFYPKDFKMYFNGDSVLGINEFISVKEFLFVFDILEKINTYGIK